MLEIEGLSKETVYNVMSALLYSLNYAWFQFEDLMRANCPEVLEGEEYRRFNEEFGSYEAKRLSSALDISGEGIDGLIQFLKHSHWAVFENIEVEKLTDKSFRMRTVDCSAQRATKRWGMEYYDCRNSGFLRSAFFEAVDRNAKVQRIFAPPEIRPDGTPENVSCEWLISIEEK